MSADLRSSARRGLQRGSSWYWRGFRLRRRVRRAAFVGRVTAVAALRHAHLDLDVAPDVTFGRRVHVEIDPGTSNRLTIGPGSRVHDGVTIWLRGGTIELGREVVLRRGVEMNSSGHVRLADEALLSFRVVVHCAESVSVGTRSIVGEHSTITDSFHVRTPPGVAVLHHVDTKPTTVGDDVWIAAHAVVAAGVHVGDGAFVAASAVLTKDVPDGWLVAGNPAQPVRALDGWPTSERPEPADADG